MSWDLEESPKIFGGKSIPRHRFFDTPRDRKRPFGGAGVVAGNAEPGRIVPKLAREEHQRMLRKLRHPLREEFGKFGGGDGGSGALTADIRYFDMAVWAER